MSTMLSRMAGVYRVLRRTFGVKVVPLGIAVLFCAVRTVVAIGMALENNKDIEVTRKNVKIAEFDLQAARGVYEPRFSGQSYYERATVPPDGCGTAVMFLWSSFMLKLFATGTPMVSFTALPVAGLIPCVKSPPGNTFWL